MKLVASRSSFSSFSATRRIYWCLSSMEKSPPAAAFIACLDLSDLCQPRGHFSLLLSFFYFSCYLLTPSLLFFLACNTTAKIFCQISAFYSKKIFFFYLNFVGVDFAGWFSGAADSAFCLPLEMKDGGSNWRCFTIHIWRFIALVSW